MIPPQGDGRTELTRQADICQSLGSDFVAQVLKAASRQLHQAPMTEAVIASWPGDRAAAAIAMRLNGALHAIARRGAVADLSALYRGEHAAFDRAIGTALRACDAFIIEWLRDPTQTNEVGRSAALMAALMVAADRFGLPFDLNELGTSCGLNLNLGRYSFDLGGTAVGESGSALHIAPEWRGPQPKAAPVEIASACGVDRHPLDARNTDSCERLLAFIWADQHNRTRRLERALEIARAHPPRIDEGEAIDWISGKLATPQQAGVCRVVFHSMFRQYLPGPEQARLTELIVEAAAHATDERPLAWISLEWTPNRTEVQLSLTCWPGGQTQVLATCHPYGEWIAWKG
ncbi:DUF2332 family protein [Blastomonas sp. AAP53]|uniref:DUF2332 domain-containing protein n=1 Tax=Blastomonas sp. AAP53 TaxID=1248760 RepID=UPI0002E04BE9|nr:DUF2332 family protein [Blastomonas sp. AAP53]